ncbi:MAG TPA: serine/threonine-protein kinase, partial [Enhygromyxa sp.]|nr:serine/threonine-protein kinase [Enhygromyxa sp.]
MVMGALERLDPPRVLGDLTLLAALGEGGMATVYLAGVGSGPLARMCAVKLLRANLPDHDYRTRFLDEARLVVRLHHNNIVDVRAAGEIDGQLYIAMEAIEGRDLADVWDRCAEVGRAFPVPLAVYVCREVLRGLHYAHTFPGLGLVHRDVSPSNVLIDWAGAVRLADFGLATSSLKASLTLPGVVFGKVGYMSPEQARH